MPRMGENGVSGRITAFADLHVLLQLKKSRSTV
jgi:hypothetical protein